jgi:transcriptional regulator with XRE-family HTH domain
MGLSRAELALKVGVGTSAAVQWELLKGTSPSVGNLATIAQVTDVSFEWLATGRGPARLAQADEPFALHKDCIAHDLYEEQILILARKVPRAHRDHLVRYLTAVYS